MKKTSIITAIIFTSLSLSAQVWEDNLVKTNDSPTMFDKFDAFEKHRSTHPYTKGNGYKPYARGMDFIMERVSNSNSFNPNSLYIEWKK